MLEEIIIEIAKGNKTLSIETIDELKKISKVLELKKGTQLVNEGTYTDKLYFIYKGCGKASHLQDGKSVTDWLAFESEFICAITGYFLKTTSEHTIELLEESILLEFKREKLNAISKRHNDFERFLRIAVTKIMLQLQERVEYLQYCSAKERYEFLLKRYPTIEQRIPLGDIASYIGITQETLSRIRANNVRF